MADDTPRASEMSWADVTTALRLGARPEEVITRARTLLSPRVPQGTASPPPSPPAPPSPPDVRALYRTLPGTDASVQLCYLRAPLQLLEARRSGKPRLDGEMRFDVLSMFRARVVAPPAHQVRVVLARAGSAAEGVRRDATTEAVPRGAAALRALGAALAETPVRVDDVVRARALRRAAWAVTYPAYAASASATPADAARALLRDAPSGALASYVLAHVVPTLDVTAARDVAAAASTAARESALPAADVAAAVGAFPCATSALDVLDAVVR